MSFPALLDFERDKANLTFSRWRVYLHCRESLTFHEPHPVKVWPLCEALHMRKRSVISALDWLVSAGYVVEHGRDGKTRRLTLAYERRRTAA